MICRRDLAGLWRRILIAWPDGRSDTETEVLWLQGPHLYADLRVPTGRPTCPHVACLRDLDWTMLRFMARQEGFFGHFNIVNSVGEWHRTFDYQPDTGVSDRGALAFKDGILIERGIELPYVEHWVREPGSDNVLALSLATESGAPGCLIVSGDIFVYARRRPVPLPRGVTLDQLIDDAASLEAAQDLFDCEISFGRRQMQDNSGNWRIAHSSHCFREGASLSPTLDSVTGSLVIDDITPEGASVKRTWRVTASESAVDAPLSLWLESDGAHDAPQSSEPSQSMTTETLGTPP